MASARATALEVLARVQGGTFASAALSEALRDLNDVRDRALVTDLVYTALRHDRWLRAALEPLLSNPEGLPPRVQRALTLGAAEILLRGTPRHAAVNEWVNLVKRASQRLGGVANAVLRRVEAPEEPARAVRYSLPDWLLDEFDAALGDNADAAAAGMLSPEPLWLTALVDNAAEILVAEGCDVRPGPLPQSLSVKSPEPLQELESYIAGLVQPQNPASLLVTVVLDAPAGARVLDLCSGNGIKAAVMAASGADVTSVELDRRKIRRARQNQSRLQVQVNHLAADLTEVPPGLEPAPYVLLDAPCTGTGTLRGHPEIKLRVTPQDVESAAALQAQLLRTAAALTEPGGRLVYAVCSLTRAEGPDVIARFLEENPRFTPEPVRADVPLHAHGAGAFVVPADGLDGFYVSSLRLD